MTKYLQGKAEMSVLPLMPINVNINKTPYDDYKGAVIDYNEKNQEAYLFHI